MEFTIDREALLAELEFVKGSVGKNNNIPTLTGICITAKGGNVDLRATNLELDARSTIKVDGDLPPVGVVVPASKLVDYVKALAHGKVSITIDDGRRLTIKAGRSRSRIQGWGVDTFMEPVTPDLTHEIDAKALASLIDSTSFAISKEASRYTLDGALIEHNGEEIQMVATDGHRLALATHEAPSIPSMLLPRAAMSEIKRMGGDGLIGVGVSENEFIFQNGERSLVVRKLAGTFPDYKRILPKEFKHEVKFNRTEAIEALNRVRQFADERTHAVSVSFSGETMEIRASIENGESQEIVDLIAPGISEEITLKMSGTYLLDALKASTVAIVSVGINTADAAIEITGENSMCVIMPMR